MLAGITVNAAVICGISEVTGSITKGLAADLVVLDGNPLDMLISL